MRAPLRSDTRAAVLAAATRSRSAQREAVCVRRGTRLRTRRASSAARRLHRFALRARWPIDGTGHARTTRQRLSGWPTRRSG
ncbi:hypothetical protein C7S14_2213 [Burkholderia cepacia]|nr:hypothetical protein C7S14_2213 [Burkholderia cepacia]